MDTQIGLIPATTEEITQWLSAHGLSTTPGVGVVLAAIRRDLAGVCSACRPATSADQFADEFAPYLAGQLRDPEVKAAYEAERRDDEVIQFGHPRWGL